MGLNLRKDLFAIAALSLPLSLWAQLNCKTPLRTLAQGSAGERAHWDGAEPGSFWKADLAPISATPQRMDRVQ